MKKPALGGGLALALSVAGRAAADADRLVPRQDEAGRGKRGEMRRDEEREEEREEERDEDGEEDREEDREEDGEECGERGSNGGEDGGGCCQLVAGVTSTTDPTCHIRPHPHHAASEEDTRHVSGST